MSSTEEKEGLLASETGSRRSRTVPKHLMMDELDEFEEPNLRSNCATYNSKLEMGMLLWMERGDS